MDPNFEGSIHQQLGMSDILCPTCQAHCSLDSDGNLICLNACHLIPESQERFHQVWLAITKGANDVETIIQNAQEYMKNNTHKEE